MSMQVFVGNFPFFAALIVLVGWSAFIIAWGRENHALAKFKTQRSRHFWLVVGGLMIAVSTFVPIAIWGIQYLHAVIDSWSRVGFVGLAVVAAVFSGLAAPVMVIITWLYVYLRPSRMARKVRGGWVTVTDVRMGRKPLPVYDVNMREFDQMVARGENLFANEAPISVIPQNQRR